ncbi:hypothetical protein BS47DRAFT_1346414, partial [Hydnum rufescens UP504]
MWLIASSSPAERAVYERIPLTLRSPADGLPERALSHVATLARTATASSLPDATTALVSISFFRRTVGPIITIPYSSSIAFRVIPHPSTLAPVCFSCLCLCAVCFAGAQVSLLSLSIDGVKAVSPRSYSLAIHAIRHPEVYFPEHLHRLFTSQEGVPKSIDPD